MPKVLATWGPNQDPDSSPPKRVTLSGKKISYARLQKLERDPGISWGGLHVDYDSRGKVASVSQGGDLRKQNRGKKRFTKAKAKRKMKSAAQKLAAWVRSQANRKRTKTNKKRAHVRVNMAYHPFKGEGPYCTHKNCGREYTDPIHRGPYQDESGRPYRLKARKKPARKSNPKPRRVPKSSAWQKAKAVRFVRTRKGVRVDVRK